MAKTRRFGSPRPATGQNTTSSLLNNSNWATWRFGPATPYPGITSSTFRPSCVTPPPPLGISYVVLTNKFYSCWSTNSSSGRNTVNPNSIRAAHLLLTKEEALQDKFLGLPDKLSTKQPKKKTVKDEGKPCLSYQKGAWTHTKGHNLDSTHLLHVCAYCHKDRAHKFSLQESACQGKASKSS